MRAGAYLTSAAVCEGGECRLFGSVTPEFKPCQISLPSVSNPSATFCGAGLWNCTDEHFGMRWFDLDYTSASCSFNMGTCSSWVWCACWRLDGWIAKVLRQNKPSISARLSSLMLRWICKRTHTRAHTGSDTKMWRKQSSRSRLTFRTCCSLKGTHSNQMG